MVQIAGRCPGGLMARSVDPAAFAASSSRQPMPPVNTSRSSPPSAAPVSADVLPDAVGEQLEREVRLGVAGRGRPRQLGVVPATASQTAPPRLVLQHPLDLRTRHPGAA